MSLKTIPGFEVRDVADERLEVFDGTGHPTRLPACGAGATAAGPSSCVSSPSARRSSDPRLPPLRAPGTGRGRRDGLDEAGCAITARHGVRRCRGPTPNSAERAEVRHVHVALGIALLSPVRHRHEQAELLQLAHLLGPLAGPLGELRGLEERLGARQAGAPLAARSFEVGDASS